MKRIFCIIILSGLTSLPLFAQDTIQYSDLTNLYIDGKYVQCIKNGSKYVDNKKTANDSYPYLILSAAYFKISLDAFYDNKYPNAYANSLNYAKLFFEKNSDSSKYKNIANTCLPQLKMYSIEEAINGISTADEPGYILAVTRMTELINVFPDVPGLFFIKAAGENYLNDTTSAELSFSKGKLLISKMTFSTLCTDEDRYALMSGLILCTGYYMTNKNYQKARATIELGEMWFSKESEYMFCINELKKY